MVLRSIQNNENDFLFYFFLLIKVLKLYSCLVPWTLTDLRRHVNHAMIGQFVVQRHIRRWKTRKPFAHMENNSQILENAHAEFKRENF